MTSRAALITGPDPAGIAVVQLLGPQCRNIIEKIFRAHPRFANRPLSTHSLMLGAIVDYDHADETIDQVIVAYDGENHTADINCHGGERIVQRILMLLQKHGVELVVPEQLTDTVSIDREVAAMLPIAKTRLAVLTLAAQYPGGLNAWAGKAIDTLEGNDRLHGSVQEDIKKLLPTFAAAQKLLIPSTVVLTGPVNTGKSTLANSLVGKPQSITSDMPGTTRDWTMQLTDVNGIPVNLIDTAGRRESGDHLERDSLARADEKITHADLVILIVEANGCEKKQIAEQSAGLPAQCEPLVVVNKCDLLPVSSRSAGEFLYISALTGHNLDQLRTIIAQRLGLAIPDPQTPLIFTERQYNLLQMAAEISSTQTIVSMLKKLIGQKD